MVSAGAGMSATDIWFAWRPVRVGALGDGPSVWWKKVWRNRTHFCGVEVAVYQELPVGFYDADGKWTGPDLSGGREDET